MTGGWLIAGARLVVPARWRDVVVDDVIEEAQRGGHSAAWLTLQLVRVGATMRWSLTADAVVADLLHAVRSLMAARWFTIGAVITFALGIGVNLAVFSAVDRIVFRPLPYADPDSLVLLRSCDRTTGECTNGSFPSAVSFQLLEHSTTIADVAVAGFSRPYGMKPDAASDERLSLIAVSPHTLRALGVRPIVGRDISDDEIASRTPAAWIAHETWRVRFGSDRSIVGRPLWTGKKSVTVLGVLPPGFIPPAWSAPNPEWSGLVVDHDGGQWAGVSPSGRSMAPFARLKPGSTTAQAQAEVEALAESIRLAGSEPAAPAEFLTVEPIGTALFSIVRRYVWLVVLAAWLVLLMSCANLASLFLARGRSREQIGAISKALGASASRLVALSIIESLVVCALGAALALAVLVGTQAMLDHFLPPMFSRYAAGVGDWRVLTFALLATCSTAIAAGAIPGIRLARVDVLPFLQRGGRARRRHMSGARTLLVFEAAVGAVLVLGAVLSLRSFGMLTHDDLGMRVEGLYSASVGATVPVPMDQQVPRMLHLLDEMAHVPGVASVATADWIPVGGERPLRGFGGGNMRGAFVQVSQGYFDALAVPIVAGRAFGAEEVAGLAHVAVFNEAAARMLWPGRLRQRSWGDGGSLQADRRFSSWASWRT
ncbi:MAG: ABC transporter permease [Vicinamibacterales bacterium]